jgi:hypothetical protein
MNCASWATEKGKSFATEGKAKAQHSAEKRHDLFEKGTETKRVWDQGRNSFQKVPYVAVQISLHELRKISLAEVVSSSAFFFFFRFTVSALIQVEKKQL